MKFFANLFKRPPSKSIGWDSAGYSKRLIKWQTDSAGINNLLHNAADTLRRRSRDVIRQNPYAANVIDTLVSNYIGTGD